MTATLTWSQRCAAERLVIFAVNGEHFVRMTYIDAIRAFDIDTVEHMLKNRGFYLFSEWSEAWLSGPAGGQSSAG